MVFLSATCLLTVGPILSTGEKIGTILAILASDHDPPANKLRVNLKSPQRDWPSMVRIGLGG